MRTSVEGKPNSRACLRGISGEHDCPKLRFGLRAVPLPREFPGGTPKERSRGVGRWNHYYVRAINGELRLWVNGEEVSGGSGAEPRTGYLCLESEGSPVEFKNIRARELP